jgi:cephalosporin hydroxylase
VLIREWRMAFGQTPAEQIRSFADVREKFHVWNYTSGVHERTFFMGRHVVKSVADLWNYQEILFDLKPRLVVEFGTNQGGSALYFASIMRCIRNNFLVLTVDVTMDLVDATTRRDQNIEFMECRSTEPRVAERIKALRAEYAGPVFFILDSDHSAQNVHAELVMLRDLTTKGDYVIVEDSNINGHPVLPGWGPGPFEAMQSYFEKFPNDYTRDIERGRKFGITYATHGFLARK